VSLWSALKRIVGGANGRHFPGDGGDEETKASVLFLG